MKTVYRRAFVTATFLVKETAPSKQKAKKTDSILFEKVKKTIYNNLGIEVAIRQFELRRLKPQEIKMLKQNSVKRRITRYV